MRVLFVVDEKKMGGVSILLEDILKNIDLSKKKVDILILHNNGDMLSDLPKNVNIIYGTKFFRTVDYSLKEVICSKKNCDIFNKLKMIFYMKTGLIKYFIIRERKKILKEKYDTEVAFKDGYCALVVGYGNAKNKIQWLHCDYLMKDHLANYKKLFLKIYDHFTTIVAISNPIKEGFNSIYGYENKTIAIYNLIDKEKIIKKANEFEVKLSDKLNLIAVGRMHPMKGYLRLIEIINKLKTENNFNAHLTLIGDGPEFDKAKKMINEFKLNDDIDLLGKINNPFPYVKAADLFLMCSIYEPFGLTIIEALTLKVPVLSTEVATINELLYSQHGLIVKNSESGLYDGLNILLNNPNRIKEYKKNLEKYNYPTDKIIKQIEEALNEKGAY